VPATRKPRLGISACLLGRRVRWDGGHRRDAFCAEVLDPLVEWVPVCPEVELGLGIPRPPIRLTGRSEAPRLVVDGSGEDLTARMQAFAEARVEALVALDLSGWITKRDSPSCGMAQVPVHDPRGGPAVRDGVGAFLRVLMARLPHLPVEEEGRLADPLLRERFMARVLDRARRAP